jgi:hypothetical protein
MKEHNVHHMFLNETGVINALKETYNLGKRDGEKDVLNWLSEMNHLSDNINYIIEEWENLKK